jgi:hypothetical protein
LNKIDKIRPACAWVAENAESIRIKKEEIPDYTRFILSKYPLVTEMTDDHHYISKNPEETAAYILALDSINFGSGYFHIAKQCGFDLEYATIAGGLKRAFENDFMNSPVKWVKVTAGCFSKMLSLPQGVHAQLDALLDTFAHHLQETGEHILSEYQGKVLNLLETAHHSAPRLASIVGGWKGFWDIHAYKGREIPILKRAQIFASDINLAVGPLKEMDRLTIFADNMVPHVLRCDGILEYAPALSSQIDGGVLLASGSAEEVEIRACAIHAVGLMKQAAGGGVTSVNLDHLLWHRGYEPEIYSRPSHRTLTADY